MASRRAASTASRASARRSSIIAARAGGRSRVGGRASGVGSGRAPRRRCARPRRGPRPGRTSRAGPRPGRRGRRGRRPAPRRGSGRGRSRGPSAAGGPARANRSRPGRRPAGRARGPRAGASGTRPEVVEDHRPDVEDERLGRLERLLDHRHELADLGAGLGRVACRRAAPRSGPGGRCWSGSGPGRRASPGRSRGAGPPGRRAGGARRPGGTAAAGVAGAGLPRRRRWRRRERHVAEAGERLGIGGERVAVAGRAPGACPRGRRPATPSARRAWSAVTSWALRSAATVGSRLGRGRRWRCRGQLVGRGDAARLVTGGLGLGLGDEQVDLGELASRLRQLVGHPRRTARAGLRAWRRAARVGHRRGSRGRRVGRDRDQSSGIRIQPWRIA